MSAQAGSLPLWRQSAMVLPGLVLLAAGVALWPSLESLLGYWRDVSDYQHGYVIAALALVWIARELWRFPAQELDSSSAAAVILALALLAWLVALRGGIDILHQLLWPLALWLAIWAAGGRPMARRLFAPLAFLYFSIPVWDYALPVLQRLSIFFSERLLALLGVAATVSEYRVTIPEGTFAIIEGCSGKRYLMVTLALAWLAIFVNRVPRRRMLAFLAVSGLLAMVTNWIRIVIVIYAGHVSEMRHYLVAVEHKTLGNVMFAFLLLAVLLLARRLGSAGRLAAPGAPASVPAGDGSHPSFVPALSVLASLLVAGLLVLRPAQASATATAAFSFPLSTDRWQGPLPPTSGWFPAYAGADAESRASYRNAAGTVESYANLYLAQGKDRELIRYGNNLVAPGGWTRPWSEKNATIASSGPRLASFQMQAPDGSSWLLAHVFLVGKSGYRGAFMAKVAYGWKSIWGPAPSGVIAMASRCDMENCDDARARISELWDNQHLRLQAMMPAGAQRFP